MLELTLWQAKYIGMMVETCFLVKRLGFEPNLVVDLEKPIDV
jgi:hypothetical protein